MQVSNPNNSIKYQTALGAIHVKSADCKNAVQRSLELNLNIVQVIAGSQGTDSLIPFYKVSNHVQATECISP